MAVAVVCDIGPTITVPVTEDWKRRAIAKAREPVRALRKITKLRTPGAPISACRIEIDDIGYTIPIYVTGQVRFEKNDWIHNVKLRSKRSAETKGKAFVLVVA